MSQYIELHPVAPDPRSIALIVDSLCHGAVIAYPTDSGYALGCLMGLAKPLERIRQLRQLDNQHNFTLICRSLSEISRYARVDNPNYRILKRCTPGGYTFILPATHDVPKLMLAKRQTVGIRIPDHPIALAIVEALGEPLMSSSLILPDENDPLYYPEDVGERVGEKVDIVIDGGYSGFEPTTIVDLSEGEPQVLRFGSGDASIF